MAAIRWKKNKVISIGTRRGSVYVLAQMLDEPFLAVFNLFREDDEWADVDLTNIPLLFCRSVTRQFLKYSRTRKVSVAPHIETPVSDQWIDAFPGTRSTTLWSGTSLEREMIVLGEKPGAGSSRRT